MDLLPEYFPDLTGFQWDAGNSEKNWLVHEVRPAEVEQAFYNRPVLVSPDSGHSHVEVRYDVLGRSNADRTLAIVFTVRATLVQPILARDMSRRERRPYAEQEHAEEALSVHSAVPDRGGGAPILGYARYRGLH